MHQKFVKAGKIWKWQNLLQMLEDIIQNVPNAEVKLSEFEFSLTYFPGNTGKS